jgi:hypothetical protein
MTPGRSRRVTGRLLLLPAALRLGGMLGSAAFLAARSAAPSASPTPRASATPSATRSPNPTPSLSPTPSPTPTPAPTPEAYEDLSGIPTTKELAHRYPIAVMLDDHPDARPQAGLAYASIVYQAPVEGYIPRYMAVFQAGTPPAVGPVRSARRYFVRWASETRAVYVHHGGPLPLLRYLNSGQGNVINADGASTYRVGFRASPHNVYTTGERLRTWADKHGATQENLGYDPTKKGALQAFRDPVPLAKRGPDGGTIQLVYALERVDYRFSRKSSTWLRFVDGKPQHDTDDEAVRSRGTGSGPRIQPRTVIVMIVPIRRTGSINGPALGAMEADSIGSNTAWIFTEGRVLKGTWEKRNETARTRFLDPEGKRIVLPRGQIFIQVITGSGIGGRLSFDVEAAKP